VFLLQINHTSIILKVNFIEYELTLFSNGALIIPNNTVLVVRYNFLGSAPNV
jgi:hypothetical protein